MSLTVVDLILGRYFYSLNTGFLVVFWFLFLALLLRLFIIFFWRLIGSQLTVLLLVLRNMLSLIILYYIILYYILYYIILYYIILDLSWKSSLCPTTKVIFFCPQCNRINSADSRQPTALGQKI